MYCGKGSFPVPVLLSTLVSFKSLDPYVHTIQSINMPSLLDPSTPAYAAYVDHTAPRIFRQGGDVSQPMARVNC